MVEFRTREQLGLRKPRSFSRNITPELGGVAAHWGGSAQRNDTHSQCEETWRQWQKYHMDRRGWVDIAYTMGFCQHGYVLAGRGFYVRTAANGTNDGNLKFYAFTWVGGQGQKPSALALEAFDWCIAEARKNGSAGMEVKPHRVFTGSTCPGPELSARAADRNNKPIPQLQEEEMVLERGDSGRGVALIQQCYNNWAKLSGRPAIKDKAGIFGMSTEEAIKTYQAAAQLDQTGKVDGVTTAFLLRYERG